MGKAYKFKIGDWVKFKKYYKVSSCGGERYAHGIGLSKPIIGQVCGAVIRQTGKFKTHEWDYHNEHPYLVDIKAMIFYQIRNGMINVPFEVREKDMEFTSERIDIPWRKTYVSERFRKEARELAQDMPRNEKGEFVKELILAKIKEN